MSREHKHYEVKEKEWPTPRGSFRILVGMGKQGVVLSDRSGKDGRRGVHLGDGAYHQMVNAVQVLRRSNLRASAALG